MVRVAVRVRPALQHEISEDGTFERCLGICDSFPNRVFISTRASLGGAPALIQADGSTASADVESYKLDRVFDERASTGELYREMCEPVVRGVAAGVSGCLLCYGMTGSGKTHTMLGDKDSEGVAVLAARQLLHACTGATPGLDLYVSFVEVYGERVRDLLAPPPRQAQAQAQAQAQTQAQAQPQASTQAASPWLPLRLSATGTAQLPFATLARIASAAACGRLLRRGQRVRARARHLLNAASSRSHAVLSLSLCPRAATRTGAGANTGASAGAGTGTGAGTAAASAPTMPRPGSATPLATLRCVDLAGAERVKDSGADGTVLAEARGINLSLFHLARLVHALGAGATRLPVQDCTLTRLLADSLGGGGAGGAGGGGGRGSLAVVVTASPARRHAPQTTATLAFARSCARVRTAAAPPLPRLGPPAPA
eukprot:g7941.t1